MNKSYLHNTLESIRLSPIFFQKRTSNLTFKLNLTKHNYYIVQLFNNKLEENCVILAQNIIKQKVSPNLLYMRISGFQRLAGGTLMSFTLLYSVVFHLMFESVHSWWRIRSLFWTTTEKSSKKMKINKHSLNIYSTFAKLIDER